MKSRFSASNSETLASEIAALAGAPRTDLTSRWCALCETEPPRRISRELLKRAIAYRLQELTLGGLKTGDAPPVGQDSRRCVCTTSDRALAGADPDARYRAVAQLARDRAPGDRPRSRGRVSG